MPALTFGPLLDMLLRRNGSLDGLPLSPATRNATAGALQVVCAWPVSGQYGPGSRLLYYVLVAACVFARKVEWLKSPCLAAALLFPAVAAIHGIVLAALHVDGAVDMDVFGALQLCTIGILAAPATVRLSSTYFQKEKNPGRDMIFLWTGLLLAGLLSLTVEFFRITTSSCVEDGNPLSIGVAEFSYTTPDQMTFGTATLIAAACCIPAVLSLISTWQKILEFNFNKRLWREERDEAAGGFNFATVGMMKRVDDSVVLFQSLVEIVVFGAAVLAIVFLGERNFWSSQVRYRTEPIASIGQWAPIVGTFLAAMGSLYVLLATAVMAVEEQAQSVRPSNVSVQEVDGPDSAVPADASKGGGEQRRSRELVPPTPTTPAASPVGPSDAQPRPTDVGYRIKFAKILYEMARHLGTPAPDRFDDSGFKHGPALNYPEIPGEEHRNSGLPRIRDIYNLPPDAAASVTTRRHSRASSCNGSVLEEPTLAIHQPSNASSSSTPVVPQRSRRATLAVPSHMFGASSRRESSPIARPILAALSQTAPAIVLSADRGAEPGTGAPP